MARTRPSTTQQPGGPDAARLPMTEVPLPGVDPAWSRTVTVASTAPVEPVPGRRRRWHVLDNAASLEAAGLTPRGTVLAVHGNPTWSYLWRDVLAAGTDPANPWRVIAVDQLDMGFSERTGLFRRLDEAAAGGDGDQIGARARELEHLIDRAAAEGVIHANNAARKKSRVARVSQKVPTA